MKPAQRTEFHPQVTGGGLIFDWSPRSSRWLGKCGMVAIATAVFLTPLVLIHVSLDPLPVQESKSAGMVLISGASDPLGWYDEIRAQGPFPTRFDPTAWEPAQKIVDAVLRSQLHRGASIARPRFLDFPVDDGVLTAPLVAKGERVLPRVPLARYPSVDTNATKTLPVLYSLSSAQEELPLNRPSFQAEVTTEMDSQLWRFLLQVAPNGRVVHTVAMVGHNTPGREVLTEWLERHHFPAIEGARNRWVAIAITFQNQLIHESNDP